MIKRRRLFFSIIGACVLFLTASLLWGVGPTLACYLPTKDTLKPGMNVLRIESEGRQRCSLLYLPPDYEDGRTLPVILSLHGFASNPHGQRAFSQWEQVAAQVQAVVLYPQGTGFPQRWNADSEFGVDGADDVSFIRDLIEQLNDQIPIDGRRLYLTGFSNGGAMALRLACELSKQFAAAATVATPVTPDLANCRPERSIPLLVFHGTEDQIVPYQGRRAEDWSARALEDRMPTPHLLAAPQWVSLWAENYGCNKDPDPVLRVGSVSGVVYEGCPADAQVVFYTIGGGGHSWPGGWRIPFVGETTKDIFASEVMWEFFKAHSLP